MSQAKKVVKFTTQFRKDYKLTIRPGLNISVFHQFLYIIGAHWLFF